MGGCGNGGRARFLPRCSTVIVCVCVGGARWEGGKEGGEGREGASPSVLNSLVIGLVALGDEISRISFQDGALCWLQLQALPIWAVCVMKKWREQEEEEESSRRRGRRVGREES